MRVRTIISVFSLLPALLCLTVCAGPLAAEGNVYIVDVKHPNASDENPGTAEAPWKTIRHAAAVAQCGDTVRIKAGRYREGDINIANSGKRLLVNRYDHWLNVSLRHFDASYVTFEAYGDGEVIVDGSVELAPALFRPVEGTKKVYAADLSALIKETAQYQFPRHNKFWLFLNDQYLLPKVDKAGLSSGPVELRYKPDLSAPTDEDDLKYYYDADNRTLIVNFGGPAPAQAGKVEISVHYSGICGPYDGQYIRLRGLTLQRFNGRTIDFSRVLGGIVTDCLIRHGGELNCGYHSVVRRNTILDADAIGINGGSFSLIDENLIIRNFRDRYQARNGYTASAITYFGVEYIRFRNNVVLESPSNGFWPDCTGNSHIHMGNTIGHCQGNAFYIEAPAFGNVLLHNVSFQNNNGIYFRQNMGNTAMENYVFGGGGAFLMGSTQVQFMRNNQVIGNWIRDVQTGIGVGTAADGMKQNRHLTDRNVFDPSVLFIARWAGEAYKTLEEYRQATGNEQHGQTAKVDESAMGLVSFRVADSSRPWERCLMFGNPTMARPEWGAMIDHPYFWRLGTAYHFDEFAKWEMYQGLDVPRTPVDKSIGGYLRQTGRYDFPAPGRTEPASRPAGWQGEPNDKVVLEVSSLPEKVISERGLGWWSVSLPTAAEAEVDLAVRVTLRDVKAAKDGGGVVMFAEWSDYTRQRVQVDFIAGRDESGTVHLAEALTGTCIDRRIAGQVMAPAWAKRLRVFFGLQDCTGSAAFDDADIQTAPGQAPPAAEEPQTTGPPNIQPKPIVDPAALDFFIVDLSKHVNRPLKDDKADDGKGGWTDQGSEADMSGLDPGDKEYQGVPFKISAPNSCLVLFSPERPQSKDLPKQANIEVGRKADVLYFLHDCAWAKEGLEQFKYVVKYDDGSKVEIPIIGGEHIFDWALGLQAKFTKRIARMRPSVAVTVGGGALFPHVNVYMLEWLNPHPEKKIAAIDFVSAGKGVPILLGITTGIRKP